MNKKMKSVCSWAVCLVTACGFVGCKGKGNPLDSSSEQTANLKQAEYNTTTGTMPSNWNELTYTDNNDRQIMSYIGSNFFDYDYKFEKSKIYIKDTNDTEFEKEPYAEISGEYMVVSQTVEGGVVKTYFKVK